METMEMIRRLERLELAPETREALWANPNDKDAQERALLLIAMFDDCNEYLD